jgi:hypothetical protein
MKKQKKQTPAIRWVVMGMAVVVLVLGLAATRTANATPHPRPRVGLTAQDVAPAERYVAYPRIAQVYEMVAQIPEVIDGIYCHCDCSKHSDHRSLLTCFQDDHGAACDVCLSEASLAFRMVGEGRSLKEIRRAVDALYKHDHAH